MKKLIVVLMLILSGVYANAQHTADIGVQLAAATYWGDIQNVNYSKSITPVVGILGRWNFNRRLAIRGQLLTGNIKAAGLLENALLSQSGTRAPSFPNDPSKSFNFNRSFQSVEGLLEFNFWNYKLGNLKKDRFTPFVAIGLGAYNSSAPRMGTFILDPNIEILANPAAIPPTFDQYLPFSGIPQNALPLTNGYKVLTLIVPVGAGFKFNFSRRLGGLVEVIIRKTFSDNIDNLDDPKRFQNPISVPVTPATTPATFINTYSDPIQGINKKDWYATLAVSLTWQLWSERGNCPIYDKIKKK